MRTGSQNNVADGGDYYPLKRTPEHLRPRELARQRGIEQVEDDVLLAILLRSGTRGRNVTDLAHGLLARYGSLTALARVSEGELASLKGIGPVKAQVLKSALELAARLAREKIEPACPCLTRPEDVAGLLRERARSLEQEVFWVLLLNAKNRLLGAPLEITRGLINACLAHPREIFREAVRAASSAIILAHNHPSGDPAPSPEDIRITRQMTEAGRIVDIRVLDHVVIGCSGAGAREYVSMREAGLVTFA